YWLDTTNNLTNSGLPYMMYQSSSDCSFTADYVLDDFYALNDELQFVINSDNSKDWYYKNGLMVANSKDAINIITEQFNGNELIILKCQNPINVDDMFIKELATEFNNKGLSIEELSTCKLGYTGGLLILIKQ
ncbi:MAG: hypothetical protein J6A59_11275, partial [Lachnospiraceae bacterium]|nr:hypothetical protein [Lachnospiraceae bacterium]